MKFLLTCLWLMAPVLILAWRYGPGTDTLDRESAIDLVQVAHAAEIDGDFVTANERYLAAIAGLPESNVAARQNLKLSAAQTLIQSGSLLEGQDALTELLAELDDPAKPLAVNVRSELAASHYHAAWLMRMEGATADEWKPEAERARQHFRLLAERSTNTEAAEPFLKNLEAVIRFEQMDVGHLQALGLPKKCPGNCKGLSKRKRKQSKNQGKGKGGGTKDDPSEKPSQKDVRQQLKKEAQGAGINTRAGSGS